MTIKCKWQVLLTDSGYIINDFNMWVPLGCKIIECLIWSVNEIEMYGVD